MKATQEIVLETDRNGRSAGLRLELHRAAERLATTVLVNLSRDTTVPLLWSMEGNDNEAWPDSPPLQDVQQLAHQPDVILATGMAGNTHWSASIEVRTAPRLGSFLSWDVACRANRDPHFLGSRFRLAATATAVGDKESNVILECRDQRFQLQPREAQGATVDDSPNCRIIVEPGGDVICVHPILTDFTPPQTIRWSFTLGTARR